MIFIAVRFHNATISKVVWKISDSFLQRYEKHYVMEALIWYENVKDIIKILFSNMDSYQNKMLVLTNCMNVLSSSFTSMQSLGTKKN